VDYLSSLYDNLKTRQNRIASMFDKVPTHTLSDSIDQPLPDEIEVGVFATGSKPSSESISRLKNPGVLQPRQGRGTFVVGNVYALNALNKLYNVARRLRLAGAEQAAVSFWSTP
jgi:hypothetical protein